MWYGSEGIGEDAETIEEEGVERSRHGFTEGDGFKGVLECTFFNRPYSQ